MLCGVTCIEQNNRDMFCISGEWGGGGYQVVQISDEIMLQYDIIATVDLCNYDH